MKFVLVNYRTPRSSSVCAHCSTPVGEGYLHDLSAGRFYCDHDCYLGLQKDARQHASPDIDYASVGVAV